MLLAGGCLVLSFLVGYFFILPYLPIPSREGPSDLSPPPTGSPLPEPLYKTVEGELVAKSTLSKALAEKHIPRDQAEKIISVLKPFINFKKIKGGKFRYRADEKGEMVHFIFELSPAEVYEIQKGPEGYIAQRKEVPLEIYLVRVEGVIRSSLFEALDSIGEKDQLVLSFAEILAAEIDFYKDVREGDRFRILVEKVYKDEEFLRYGPIHAVGYERGEKSIIGIHFEGNFYNEKGMALKKAFLRSPLRFTRISSKFSRARKHPILGGVLPHYGVDYAAPAGTPVWAVADGVVVSSGWGGGFGKQIVLRHPNGYTTYYGHLSGFAPGIRKGVRVKQKQVIGYVGSTGLSTGPHLDYRMAKDGRFKNPLKESFPEGLPIDPTKKGAFERRRDELMAMLQDRDFERRRLDVSNAKAE